MQRRVFLRRVGRHWRKRSADTQGELDSGGGRPRQGGGAVWQQVLYRGCDSQLSPRFSTDLTPPGGRLQSPRGSATARVCGGSSGSRAVAFANKRAASAVRRDVTGRMPASAITPWWGDDRMQSVTIRAAARISRSSGVTLVLGVAGSQAAAVSSSAPRM